MRGDVGVSATQLEVHEIGWKYDSRLLQNWHKIASSSVYKLYNARKAFFNERVEYNRLSESTS